MQRPLVEYAIALRLDVNQFLSEITGDVHVPRILDDINGGIESGVCSAPTLFINGYCYDGAFSLDALSAQISR